MKYKYLSNTKLLEMYYEAIKVKKYPLCISSKQEFRIEELNFSDLNRELKSRLMPRTEIKLKIK